MPKKNTPKNTKPKPYVIKPAEVFAPEGRGGCQDQEPDKK